MKKLLSYIKSKGLTLILLVFSCLITYIFLKNEISHRKEVESIKESFKTQSDIFINGNQFLTKKIDTLNGEMVRQKQINLDLQTAYDNEVFKNSELRDQLAKIEVKTITKIDTVFIKYKDNLSNDNLPDTLIVVPRSFSVKNKHYSITGTVLKSGVNVYPEIYNDLSIEIGYKPQGWFKKPIPVIDIVNKNPYTTTISANNIVIKPEPLKWYQTNLFWGGAGLLTGLIISKF